MNKKPHSRLLIALMCACFVSSCASGAPGDGGSILNSGPCADPSLSESALAAALNSTFSNFEDAGYLREGKVRYRALKDSAEWTAYEGLAGCLRGFDLEYLQAREQKLAFWINAYNALVVYGVLASGIPASVMDVDSFFDETAFEIGGVRFSLEHIEHAVLRGNRPKYLRPWAPFSKDDPALRYSLAELDPRIHLALVCAAQSCPPLSGYTPETVDEQLDEISRRFLNSSVRPASNNVGLEISSILQWYEADFGGRQGVTDLLAQWLEPGAARQILDGYEHPKISYSDYDWRLNDLP